MPLLLPDFIQSRFTSRDYKGSFEGSVIVVDISGFTSLAEELIIQEDKGVEALRDIINVVFTPAIDIIHRNRGFISHFAGDAFTAVFENDRDAALAYKALYSSIGKIHIQTLIGRKMLKTKIAMNRGIIDWKIIKAKKYFYMFSGNVLTKTAKAVKHHPDSGEKNCNIRNSEIFPKNIQSVLNSFYPKQVVNNGKNGELRTVSVMFVSYVEKNYADLASKIADIIIGKGGYFNKIEHGDKGIVVLGIFGAPVAFRDNRERAISAAIDIMKLHTGDTRIKVGLSAGRCYTGFIGSDRRGEYTAIGEIVNRTSRIMSAAPWGELRADNQMKSKYYSMEHKEDIRMKGYSNKISIFGNFKKQYSSHYRIREKEMETLHQQMKSNSNENRENIFHISGKNGSGRSEFVDEYCMKYGYTAYRIYCNSTAQEPLKPIIDCIERNGLINKVTGHMKKYSSLINLLPSYLFMTGAEVNWKHLPSDKKLIYSNFVDFVRKIIAVEPKDMIIIDDAHMMDNETASLIQSIIDYNRSKTSFIFISNDNDRVKCIETANTIILGPLSDMEIMNICEEQLGHPISENTLNLIKEKTGSLPVYVYRTIEVLKDHMKTNENGYMDIEKSNTIMINLESLIISQIDRIPAKCADFVKKAAVIGYDIDPKMIGAVYGIRISQLCINRLIKENIITSDNMGGYRFNHGTIRDSIYKTMLTSERINHHRQIARSIKSTGKNRKKINPVIAYHFEHGEMEQKAVKYYLAAAEYEKGLYLNDAAIEHYQSAYDLSNDEYKKSHILLKTGNILELKGEWSSALKEYTKALKLCRSESSEMYGDICSSMGNLFWTQGKYSDALDYLQRAVKLFKKNDNDYKLTYALGKIGNVFWRQGDYTKALRFYNKQLQLCSSKQSTSNALSNIAALEYDRGHLDKAYHLYRKQLKLTVGIKQKQARSIIYGNLGNISVQKGEYDNALKYNMKRLKIAEEIGDRMRTAISMGTLGNIYRMKKTYDKALMFYNQALNEFKELGHKAAISITLGNMGICFYHQFDYKNAMHYYKKHYSSAEKINDKAGMQRAVGNMGNVLWRTGKLDKAEKKIRQQIILAEELSDKLHRGIAISNLANVMRDKGKIKEAMRLYNKAARILRNIGAKPFLSACLTEKAKMYADEGKMKDAKRMLKELKTLASELKDEEIIFELKLLEARIAFKGAEKILNMMLKEYKDDEKRGLIMYYKYRLSKEDADRKQCIKLLRKSNAERGVHSIKSIIEELRDAPN